MKQTGNLKLVMNAMGHVDVKTAMKYQHPELELVRAALNVTIRRIADWGVAGNRLRHTLRRALNHDL